MISSHDAAGQGTIEHLDAALIHELAQPLSAVELNVEVALRALESPLCDRQGPALVDVLRDIERDVRRAAGVLHGLRAIYVHQPLTLRLVDINGVVCDAMAIAHTSATVARPTLALDLAQDLPMVLGQDALLTQVVHNLLKNASEAMETTIAPARLLRVTTSERDGAIEIAVSDTGPGIAAAVGSRLFQRMVTTKPRGRGVGLRVAARIVAEHGGTIEVRDTSCRGTTIAVTLPAA